MITRILILIKVNKTMATPLLMPLIFVFTRDVWIRTQRAAVASKHARYKLSDFQADPNLVLRSIHDFGKPCRHSCEHVKQSHGGEDLK